MACPAETTADQHWEKIISFVRGSEAAKVWFALKEYQARSYPNRPLNRPQDHPFQQPMAKNEASLESWRKASEG